MRSFQISLTMCLLFVLSSSLADGAQRTFVSAESGNDLNDCSRPTPCRGFNKAITLTDAGGEVIALDSGGYGTVTITGSISLIAAPGAYAGITAFSGSAITINNVDNAHIVLRGLSLNGLGGARGIDYEGSPTPLPSVLYVENSSITGFSSSGIWFNRTGQLFVTDTLVRRSGTNGIWIHGFPPYRALASLRRVQIEKNSDGLRIQNARASVRDSIASGNDIRGILVSSSTGDEANLVVDNCLIDHNFGAGLQVSTSGGTAILTVANSTIMNNDSGVFALASGVARASNNTVVRNVIGFNNLSGTFESRRDNTVQGNGTNLSGTITSFTPD